MGCCDPCGNVARLGIVALTTLGIVFQIMSAEECDWIKYTDESNNVGYFGPFYWQLIGETQCTEYGYGDVANDAMLKGARAVMVFALIFAFVAGCLVTFEFLCCKVPFASCLESITYAAAIVCSCLVYIAYGSEMCYNNNFNCSFGKGSTYNLLALMAYCGASVIQCCSPKPTPLISQCRK